MHEETLKPKALSDTEKYEILGALTDCQRQLMSVVIARSRSGLWTQYKHVEGCKSPEKRMSELVEAKRFKINFRFCNGGNRELEFCL